MNRKTSCITDEQFDTIIDIVENGSEYGVIKPYKFTMKFKMENYVVSEEE